jgi:hypothetical protein
LNENLKILKQEQNVKRYQIAMMTSLILSHGLAMGDPRHGEITLISNMKNENAMVMDLTTNWASYLDKMPLILTAISSAVRTIDKSTPLKTPVYCVVGGTPEVPKIQSGYIYNGSAAPSGVVSKMALPSGKVVTVSQYGSTSEMAKTKAAVISWMQSQHLTPRTPSPCYVFVNDPSIAGNDAEIQMRWAVK